jgi:hypothetical protein
MPKRDKLANLSLVALIVLVFGGLSLSYAQISQKPQFFGCGASCASDTDCRTTPSSCGFCVQNACVNQDKCKTPVCLKQNAEGRKK